VKGKCGKSQRRREQEESGDRKGKFTTKRAQKSPIYLNTIKWRQYYIFSGLWFDTTQ